MQFRRLWSASFLGCIHYISLFFLAPSLPVVAQQRLPHVYSGNCELNETPEWPILCAQPKAEASFLSDSSHSNDFYSYAGWIVNGGFYLTEDISIHGADHDGLMQGRQSHELQRDKHERRELYLALGNTASSKGRLLVGHFDLPFGLGDNFRPRIYEIMFKNSAFTDNYADGLQMTYDNLVNARIDIAAAFKNDDQIRIKNKLQSNQYAVRGILDLSALHGTRLSISYYRHEETGGSKVGASAFNYVEDAGESFIEWVRISDDWHKPFSNDQQIIAFGYRNIMSHNGRGLFRYEVQLGRHRLFDLGYEMSFFDVDIFSALISFEKEERPDYRQLKTIFTVSSKLEL